MVKKEKSAGGKLKIKKKDKVSLAKAKKSVVKKKVKFVEKKSEKKEEKKKVAKVKFKKVEGKKLARATCDVEKGEKEIKVGIKEKIPEKKEEIIEQKDSEKIESEIKPSIKAPASPHVPVYAEVAKGLPGLPLSPKAQIPPLSREEKEKLGEILKLYNYDPVNLLAILQDIQAAMNYIPRSWIEELAIALNIPRTRIYRIATFFKALSLKPRGKHICAVCVGTTCHVRGAPKLIDKIERDFGIKAGETTADGLLTVETVGCVGACALGPLVVLDGKYHGHMTTDKLARTFRIVGLEGKGKGGEEAEEAT